MKEDRKTFYSEIFEAADEAERNLVERLIDEVIFLEEQMTQLKTLPFVAVNQKNPALQKMTPAAKLYKESMSQYSNAIRILLNVLRKVESSAQDELLKRLEEFM